MIDVNVMTLENGKDYIITDTIINDNNNKYLFLVGKLDNNDIVIRKVITKNDGEYLVKLDSEDEFEEIMTLFGDKHKGEKNEE